MGLLTLPLGRARLNRPSPHFFFKHRDPDAADQFGDQIEDNGAQNPQSGTQNDGKEAKDGARGEQLATLEIEGIPSERSKEGLKVVDGARGAAHIPKQDPGDEKDHVERGVENQTHLEDAPRIDVTDDAGDLADAATRWSWCCADGHLLSVLTMPAPPRSEHGHH